MNVLKYPNLLFTTIISTIFSTIDSFIPQIL